MSKFDLIYRFASFFCVAAKGLVSSREEAADILGIGVAASPEEINAAYRIKAKKLHPDLNPGIDPMQIKLVNSAKEYMLSFPFEEKKYVQEKPQAPIYKKDVEPSPKKDIESTRSTKRHPIWGDWYYK